MSKLKRALPLLIIFLYIVLAVIKLSYPGLQYDELLFGNAALGNFDGSFIYKKIFKIPVMLMAYIGALKAYCYFPIFLIFNPSYLSVRLPVIFLTAASLWLIYKFVVRAADFPTAVVSILFLAAEANFISLTRTDVGPVVIGLFFRALALLYFFKFAEDRHAKNLIIVVISLLLGFYDKLNFVWFIAAFVVAAVIFYGGVFGGVFELFKVRRAKIIALICGMIFGVLIFLVFRLGVMNEISIAPTREHLTGVFNNALGLTNGSGFYEYLIGDWNGTFALGWAVWTVIAGGSIAAFFEPPSKLKTFHFFNLLILFLVFAEILLTDKANAPWHIFMLQPMTAILTASSLVFFGKTIFARHERRRTAFFVGSALVIFGAQLFNYMAYISAYEKPYRNFMWSKKIDELSEFSLLAPNRFAAVDWGFHNQLLTLGRRGDKYYELAYLFNDPLKPADKQWLKNHFINPESDCLFLLHNEKDTLFKAGRNRFFETVEEFGMQAELVKTFDESGRSLYEIYRLKQK